MTTESRPGRPPPAATRPPPSDDRIAIEEFQKVRLRDGPRSSRPSASRSRTSSMRLEVDLGDERRQIVAGIAAQYEPEALVGRNVVIVANLKPAKLMGVESNGMVLAASVGEAGEPVAPGRAGRRSAGQQGQVIVIAIGIVIGRARQSQLAIAITILG